MSPNRAPRLRGRPLKATLWLVLLLALTGVGGSWAVATYPGGAPDDDFHLASTWCAWGQHDAGCIEYPDPPAGVRSVRVPALDRYISGCPWTHPAMSAACAFQGENALDTVLTRVNAGMYPRGYYAVARLFVHRDPVRSLVLIRLMSFVVCAMLLALAGAVLSRRERWPLWWNSALLAVPLGLFLFASNNPSGLTVAGVVAVCCGSYATGRATDRRHLLTAAAVGLAGAVVASQSRPDGWQFTMLAAALGGVASLRRSRALLQPLRLAGWLAIVLVAITSWLTADRSPANLGAALATTPTEREYLVATNLLDIPSLYVGPDATTLGWLDTPMPSLVWALVALAWGAVLIVGLADLTRGRAAALALAFGAGVAAPMAIALSWRAAVGGAVQPRYMLPLVLVLGALLAMRGGRRVTWTPSGPQVFVVSTMAVVAQAVALHQAIQRSVTGLDVTALDLSSGLEWWWSVPVSPNLVWAAGSLSFAVLMTALGVAVVRRGEIAGPVDQAPAGEREAQRAAQSAG